MLANLLHAVNADISVFIVGQKMGVLQGQVYQIWVFDNFFSVREDGFTCTRIEFGGASPTMEISEVSDDSTMKNEVSSHWLSENDQSCNTPNYMLTRSGR